MIATASRVVRAALIAYAVFTPALAEAQSSAPGWGAESDVVSRYIWRGIPYSDGAVVQPSVWVSGRNIKLTVWSNLVVADALNRGNFDQVFVTATMTRSIGAVQLEPTLQTYASRSNGGAGDAATAEVAVRASAAAGPVRLFTDHTLDVAAFAGAYTGDAGVSHSRPIGRRIAMNVQASMGWASAAFNDVYVGARVRAVNYVAVDGELTIHFSGAWYLRPHVTLQRLVDADVRSAIGETTLRTAGIALGRGY